MIAKKLSSIWDYLILGFLTHFQNVSIAIKHVHGTHWQMYMYITLTLNVKLCVQVL